MIVTIETWRFHLDTLILLDHGEMCTDQLDQKVHSEGRHCSKPHPFTVTFAVGGAVPSEAEGHLSVLEGEVTFVR